MTDWQKIADIRRDYGPSGLENNTIDRHPLALFKEWFETVLAVEKHDPTAMVLSTVNSQGRPDSRVVLLKEIEHETFVFYTNYHSNKAHQLDNLPYCALNFYWPKQARQVRVQGRVIKVSAAQSDAYFASRPLLSQISAIVSPQSHPISKRCHLETKINDFINKHHDTPLKRPEYWGGYRVIPEQIEFWQGGDNRLHERLVYTKVDESWISCYLAP